MLMTLQRLAEKAAACGEECPFEDPSEVLDWIERDRLTPKPRHRRNA